MRAGWGESANFACGFARKLLILWRREFGDSPRPERYALFAPESGLAALAFLALYPPVSPAQQQPIEFPHDRHVAKGLECIDCHSRVDTRAEAGMPSVRKCMLCHEKVATNGAGVKILRQYAEKKREVPWVRVYQFTKAAHVKFRHAPHVRAGIDCATCHGEVSGMTVVTAQVDHTMGTCLSCHRQKQASEDCAACHY